MTFCKKVAMNKSIPRVVLHEIHVRMAWHGMEWLSCMARMAGDMTVVQNCFPDAGSLTLHGFS